MSLVSQLSSAFTAVATDMKRVRTYITGSSTGDLTGLTTTDKSSIIAAVNEVKAGSSGAPPDATATTKGLVELATDAEATTGTDTVRATTPANVAAVFSNRIDTDTALTANSDTKVASQKAVKAYADARIAAADAFVAKGVIDASTNPNYPAANAGDTYRVSVAGKIGGASGPNVEVGDMIMCFVDGTAAGTHATVGANWDIIQTNVDGAVLGPASAVSGDFATFSGTGGKLVQDSGLALDTTTTLGTSNVKIPSQNAVKVYADARETAAKTASQPVDADLTAIAALASSADKLPYSTGAQTWSLATFTAAGRALVDDADVAAQRTTLSVYSQTELGDPTTDFAAAYSAAVV